MDDFWYWIIEYVKVLFGYGFLMFVWPTAVFRKYLKGKSVTFRFSFCVTAQIVLINTVVLPLGLFHILSVWTMNLFFWGVLIWSFRENFKITEDTEKKIRYALNGTFGRKQVLLRFAQKILNLLKKAWSTFCSFYKKHYLEYTLLLITLIYGMIYFSYGAFCDYSYGFGDMYVHHEWIYEMTQGTVFSDGVYPQALHCVIYCLKAVFGIDIYSGLLFLAGIHIVIILLAAYCLMKEVFRWRYSPIFVLILFLTVNVVCVDEVFSMSRLQWTLPQEYGFHTMYLCALYLVKYLKSKKHAVIRNKETKGVWDENLLIFLLALTASVAIHFYVTIIAFFLCVAFAVFKLHKIFNRKYFVSLVSAACLSVLIAFTPMAGALATGIPFQYSINWAVNVIAGKDTGEGRTHLTQNQDKNQTESEENSQSGEGNIGTEQIGGTELVTGTQQTGQVQTPLQPSRLERMAKKVITTVKNKLSGIYQYGYVTLYKQEKADWIIGFTCVSAFLYALYKLTAIVLLKIAGNRTIDDKYYDGYPPIIFASVLFIILYAAPFLGLPELIAGSRLCSTGQMLILMVIIIPIDMLLSLFKKVLPKAVMEGLSLSGAAALVALVWFSGNYHGYLYYELTRYNAAVMVTNEIINTLPQYTYTIVSPTDEIYQVIEHGRHEELVTFLGEKKEEDYTLPTEYVFIYVEKKPIKYAHSHFFSGPAWLAEEKYQELYKEYSLCPEIIQGEISKQAAGSDLVTFNKPSTAYANMGSRIIIESKAYAWCLRFMELYPYELKTFYEDDDFVCYYFKQNTQYLYDLELE